MCDVFSWIEKDGNVWFLDDKDCQTLMEQNPRLRWNDVVGHSAIRTMYKIQGGKDCEAFEPVPPEIADAVNLGRCDRLLKENGWAGLRYNAEGKIKSPDKPRNKHFLHAKKRMTVWQAGYGLLCDVDGVLYVYRMTT